MMPPCDEAAAHRLATAHLGRPPLDPYELAVVLETHLGMSAAPALALAGVRTTCA